MNEASKMDGDGQEHTPSSNAIDDEHCGQSNGQHIKGNPVGYRGSEYIERYMIC